MTARFWIGVTIINLAIAAAVGVGTLRIRESTAELRREIARMDANTDQARSDVVAARRRGAVLLMSEFAPFAGKCATCGEVRLVQQRGEFAYCLDARACLQRAQAAPVASGGVEVRVRAGADGGPFVYLPRSQFNVGDTVRVVSVRLADPTEGG